VAVAGISVGGSHTLFTTAPAASRRTPFSTSLCLAARGEEYGHGQAPWTLTTYPRWASTAALWVAASSRPCTLRAGGRVLANAGPAGVGGRARRLRAATALSALTPRGPTAPATRRALRPSGSRRDRPCSTAISPREEPALSSSATAITRPATPLSAPPIRPHGAGEPSPSDGPEGAQSVHLDPAVRSLRLGASARSAGFPPPLRLPRRKIDLRLSWRRTHDGLSCRSPEVGPL